MMNNITLIGMMGSGKSTIAKALKQYYNYDIIDTDDSIEAEQNMSISEMFKENGEEFFRELEHKYLEKLTDKENCIISTGGGIILNDSNVTLLKEISKVIYLKGSCDTLLSRLLDETDKRPLLEKNELKANLEGILEKRRDLYETASNLIINIDEKDVSEIALEIYERLK